MPSKTRSKETVSSKKRAEVADLDKEIKDWEFNLRKNEEKKRSLDAEIASIEGAEFTLDGQNVVMRDLKVKLEKLDEDIDEAFREYETTIQNNAAGLSDVKNQMNTKFKRLLPKIKNGNPLADNTPDLTQQSKGKNFKDVYDARLRSCRDLHHTVTDALQEKIEESENKLEKAETKLQEFKEKHPDFSQMLFAVSKKAAPYGAGAGGIVTVGAAALAKEEAAKLIVKAGLKVGFEEMVKEGGKLVVKEGAKKLATNLGCAAIGGGVFTVITVVGPFVVAVIHEALKDDSERKKLAKDKDTYANLLTTFNNDSWELRQFSESMDKLERSVKKSDRKLSRSKEERDKLLGLNMLTPDGETQTFEDLLKKYDRKNLDRKTCLENIGSGKQSLKALQSSLEKAERSLVGSNNQTLFGGSQDAHVIPSTTAHRVQLNG